MIILVDFLILYLVINMILKISVKYKTLSFYLNTLILTIITGSFYEKIGGGGDYDNYRIAFNKFNWSDIPDGEIGFYYLNLIIKLFTDNFAIVFFIFILLINFLILKILYRYSKNIEMSLLLYVVLGGYITATNITRQFIALAIFFYSIKYILKNDYLSYIALNIIAILFHSTVIIASILTLIVKKYNNNLYKHYKLYFILVNSLIIIEPIIREIALGFVDKNYSMNSFNYGSNILHYVVQLGFITFYYLNIKNIQDSNIKFFVNMAMITSGFTILSQNMVLYARIASYFNSFNLLACVNILYYNKNIKERRIYTYFILIFILIYYFYLTRRSLSQNVNLSSYILDFFSKGS